jgi:hypothetical protein
VSIDSPWQILGIIWALISFWIGGLGLLIALTVTCSRNHPEPEMGGWRRILFNLLVVFGGIAALAWVFDPPSIVQQTGQAVLGIALFVVMLAALYGILRLLTRGRVGRIFLATWWPRIRVPAALTLAAGTLLVAETEADASVRAALMLFAGLQVLLVIWNLWLHWHFRDR